VRVILEGVLAPSSASFESYGVDYAAKKLILGKPGGTYARLAALALNSMTMSSFLKP